MARKGKNLSDDDREVWNKVARSTRPLQSDEKKSTVKKPARMAVKIAPASAGAGKQQTGKARAVSVPAAAVDLRSGKGGSGPVMDRRRFDRLRRGKIAPQARIDLHGMTAANAHPALVGFITRAHAQGIRLVLVITGKGNVRRDDAGFMPVQRGVLRHSVPQWLQRPPIGPLVLEVTQAHLRHGGGGALYVYLRRVRE